MMFIPINATKEQLKQALIRAEEGVKNNPNSDVHKMLLKGIKAKLAELENNSK